MKYLLSLVLISLLSISCDVLRTDDSDLVKDLEIKNTKITNLKDIGGTYTLVNNTDNSLVFNFGSSCQYAFKVFREDVEIFNSKEKLNCFLGHTSFVLEKGESKSFELDNSYRFDVPLEKGSYTIKSFLIGYEKETGATVGFIKSY